MSMSFLLMFFGNMICFLLGCLYSDWSQKKMNILIKNIKMPTACYECPMYQADIYYCSATERDIDIPDSSMGRCSFCPLFPVPEHGRLIDAEPIMKFITDGLNSGEFGYDQIKVLTEIQYAPTIIPANNKNKE